jgi:hypothetical protein
VTKSSASDRAILRGPEGSPIPRRYDNSPASYELAAAGVDSQPDSIAIRISDENRERGLESVPAVADYFRQQYGDGWRYSAAGRGKEFSDP